MPGKYVGDTPPWGYGHHAGHVKAAKLGWRTRRRHEREHERTQHEAHHVRALLGDLEDVRPSPDGRQVAFRSEGSYYTVEREEWRVLAREGRGIEREERIARAEAAKMARIEDRRRRAEQREREAVERHLEAEQRAFRAGIIKDLRRWGGVRPTYDQTSGKTYDEGEWRLLPAAVRRKKGGRLTMDRARAVIMEGNPWLGWETPDDMVSWFERDQLTRDRIARQRKARRQAEQAERVMAAERSA